jgi:hypothetical protein
MYLGVEATVNFATAAPLGVKRSSGSFVRFPTNVMFVSPAAIAIPSFDSSRSVSVIYLSGADLLEYYNFGAEHCLIEVELAVQLLH